MKIITMEWFLKRTQDGPTSQHTTFYGNSSHMEDGTENNTGLFIFFVILTAVGTTGNVIVIGVVACHSSLWKPFYFYVLNVAMADFLLCAVCAPYNALTAVTGPDPVGCGIVGSLSHTLLMSSFLSLAAVAVNRLLLVRVTQERYAQLYRPSRMVASLCVVWLASILYLIPSLTGHSHAGFDHNIGMCISMVADEKNFLYEVLVISLVGVPSLLITYISYYKIWRTVHTSVTTVQQHSITVTAGIPRDTLRVTQKLFTITAVFTFCWVPNMLITALDNGFTLPLGLHRACALLAVAHSMLNPILCACFNKNIAQRCWASLKWVRKWGKTSRGGTKARRPTMTKFLVVAPVSEATITTQTTSPSVTPSSDCNNPFSKSIPPAVILENGDTLEQI